MYTLYDYKKSGNCYKIRLLLTQLNIPFKSVEVDFVKGETRTEEFLKINPIGRLPALKISDNEVLVESNSILYYLSEGTKYLPKDKLSKSRVLQWLFFEQYNHEPNIATLRYWRKILNINENDIKYKYVIEDKNKKGYEALEIMENHLANIKNNEDKYFVDNKYTIADICLYVYTHVAHEGGFNLSLFSNINIWIKNVEKQENYITMDH